MLKFPAIDMLEIARIAEGAGHLILEIYNSGTPLNINQKADDSPLTVADQKANDYIVSELQRLYSGIPIISEEEKELPFAERATWVHCWEVDPLDGTKEFISRNGEFCVNIALISEGRAVAGVVHAPARSLTAWAATGKGAWLRNDGGKPKKLMSAPPGSGEKIAVIASRSHSSPEMEAYLARLADPQITNAGSAVKFLRIAMGEAHIYPRLVPTMEWDTSAGQIILEEAGGEVIDEVTGKPMVYNRENLLNSNFIAYAAGVRTVLKEFFV